MPPKKVVVIGAGAGGMIAAARAAESDASVLLLEKTNRPGNKLRLTGNQRCNLTNSVELDGFVSAFGPNGRWLYQVFHRFFREDLLELLWRYGIATKEEEDGRIFPASGNSEDVVAALEQYMTDTGVQLRTNARATGITVSRRRVVGVKIGEETCPATSVVLAAGGASYPETGSAGDGYRLAQELGHKIVPPRPSLVPLVVQEADLVKSMMGASLRNAKLTFWQGATSIKPRHTAGSGLRTGGEIGKAKLLSQTGEVIFTHFGLSGPAVLRSSLAVVEALEKTSVNVSIDFFPAMNDQQLRELLQNEFNRFGKRGARNLLRSFVPHKIVDPILRLASVPPDKEGHQINAEERDSLVALFKDLRFNIKSSLPLSSAMVTAGGVSLDEIDPRTMASRIVKGLQFCGEIIDVNADTGGYNLQAAFSTGYVAGEEAARE